MSTNDAAWPLARARRCSMPSSSSNSCGVSHRWKSIVHQVMADAINRSALINIVTCIPQLCLDVRLDGLPNKLNVHAQEFQMNHLNEGRIPLQSSRLVGEWSPFFSGNNKNFFQITEHLQQLAAALKVERRRYTVESPPRPGRPRPDAAGQHRQSPAGTDHDVQPSDATRRRPAAGLAHATGQLTVQREHPARECQY